MYIIPLSFASHGITASPEHPIERRSAVSRRRRMRDTSGPAYTIPAGKRFEGRVSGGSNRTQVYGTRTYGSGYPGESGRGTSGRNFPFIYWPIAWTNVPSSPANADYLIRSGTEYGNVTNSSEIRPGGPLKVSIIPSKSTPTEKFYLLGDEYTVTLLGETLSSNCSIYLDDTFLNNSSISAFINTPAPEQVVQYYRASSLALALDGYNNSATYASEAEGARDSNLPSWTNTDLLDCLNQTIGNTVPLRSEARINSISSLWVTLWLFVLLKFL